VIQGFFVITKQVPLSGMTILNGKYFDRKRLRLENYDYAQPGYYFVTIRVGNSVEIFGEVKNFEMVLNKFGEIAQKCWLDIPKHFLNVLLDYFVIMTNHIHGIIIILPEDASMYLPGHVADDTDVRDVDVRDERDVRDVRDVRDIRDVRDVLDVTHSTASTRSAVSRAACSADSTACTNVHIVGDDVDRCPIHRNSVADAIVPILIVNSPWV